MKKWLQAFLLTFICFTTADAWWSTPHMLVSQIAYDHLTPEARKRADFLIAQQDDGYDFVTAALWADDIKKYDHTYDTWHYVSLPFEEMNDPMPTKADFPPQYQVAWAIEHEKAILKDNGSTDAEKGLALRRLIHWVGDIHEPMHTVEHFSKNYPQGDKGGNLFLLSSPDPVKNLHLLWDMGLGEWMEDKPRPLSDESKQEIMDEAAALTAQAPSDLGSMDPYVWAIDHHAMARANAYTGIEYKGIPSDAYIAQGEPLTHAQVTLAGLRLASILNEVL